MGNSNSKFERSKWKQIQTLRHSIVLSHKLSSMFVQQYTVPLEESPSLAQFNYRRRQKLLMSVKILQVKHMDCPFSCQAEYLRVITEYVPFRLSDYFQLQQKTGLSILKECLSAYQQIYDNYQQNFTVTADMVGIIQSRQIRVWLNSNFVSNQPQFLTQSSQGFEHKLVESIINMVRQKTICQKDWNILSKDGYNFQSVLQNVYELTKFYIK